METHFRVLKPRESLLAHIIASPERLQPRGSGCLFLLVFWLYSPHGTIPEETCIVLVNCVARFRGRRGALQVLLHSQNLTTSILNTAGEFSLN